MIYLLRIRILSFKTNPSNYINLFKKLTSLDYLDVKMRKGKEGTYKYAKASDICKGSGQCNTCKGEFAKMTDQPSSMTPLVAKTVTLRPQPLVLPSNSPS